LGGPDDHDIAFQENFVLLAIVVFSFDSGSRANHDGRDGMGTARLVELGT